jgi:hypothetical protein
LTTAQQIKLATTSIFLEKAVNGGLLKCVGMEKDQVIEKNVHFTRASFDTDKYQIMVTLDDGTIEKTVLPESYGIEMVDAKDNPDYEGFQRMGVWDNQNMYCFDAKW